MRRSLVDLQRVRLETKSVHLIVVGHVLVDGLLDVTRQVGHHHRALRLRRRWLEGLRREDALEPWHPFLEDGQVLRRVLPVQHPVLEFHPDLVAEETERCLCFGTNNTYVSCIAHWFQPASSRAGFNQLALTVVPTS